MRTVKDRITQHNINAWDDTTEEAWITVNDCMYKILSKPDDASLGPTLNTWGVISGMASVYTCLVTPLRVSKMIGFENNSLWGGWENIFWGDAIYYESIWICNIGRHCRSDIYYRIDIGEYNNSSRDFEGYAQFS